MTKAISHRRFERDWPTVPLLMLAKTPDVFAFIQISYWLHVFPELYFQKVKKEDMPARIQHASLYLFFIVAAYLVSLSFRLG